MTDKAYRIITDEPQGVCIGFCPMGEGFEVEELRLLSDSGGVYVFIDGDSCFIADQSCVHHVLDGYQVCVYSEPRFPIWRSETEFNKWRNE
jgi:hypothetical protein